MPLPSFIRGLRGRTLLLFAHALLAVALGSAACGPPPPPPAPPMEKFNAALCPKIPAEDTSRPLDPNLDGLKADITLAERTVQPAAKLRISLMLRNIGLHGISVALPQKAFTLEGFELVDHACAPVKYIRPATAKALAYKDSGPMPLNAGESATLDSTLDGLAPGLELARGIYAIRLALRIDAGRTDVRGKTVYTDWTLFSVRGL